MNIFCKTIFIHRSLLNRAPQRRVTFSLRLLPLVRIPRLCREWITQLRNHPQRKRPSTRRRLCLSRPKAHIKVLGRLRHRPKQRQKSRQRPRQLQVTTARSARLIPGASRLASALGLTTGNALRPTASTAMNAQFAVTPLVQRIGMICEKTLLNCLIREARRE